MDIIQNIPKLKHLGILLTNGKFDYYDDYQTGLDNWTAFNQTHQYQAGIMESKYDLPTSLDNLAFQLPDNWAVRSSFDPLNEPAAVWDDSVDIPSTPLADLFSGYVVLKQSQTGYQIVISQYPFKISFDCDKEQIDSKVLQAIIESFFGIDNDFDDD